ncbi:hypothetical protein SASPL_141328 [Salvia splendens]|uniref:Uncharacterized protein n=1 Tax=Salvia splendens TaxID=180675 RepID=A0A8X8WTE7_SALSN|nr:hypothetical protein SASPL_141328 [Salvia splendens]
MSEIVAESSEASDWTTNWNGDDAPLAGGRKQSRNSKPAKATFGEMLKYKNKARLEEKIVRSVTKDAQGVLSQKSGEIHEELGKPPDRENDVLTMTSGLSPNDDGNMIEVGHNLLGDEDIFVRVWTKAFVVQIGDRSVFLELGCHVINIMTLSLPRGYKDMDA